MNEVFSHLLKTKKRLAPALFFCLMIPLNTGCDLFKSKESPDSPRKRKGRLVMFVGADISGSFLKSRHFSDSLKFLAQYLYAHLNGQGGIKLVHSLFVGSIGGIRSDEPKTFYPIHAFQNKSVEEIHKKLREIFPKNKKNPYTDFNAFFNQIAEFTKSKNLILRPISVVMLSDGIPDIRGVKGDELYRNLKLKPLENLSRNITLRVLYTSSAVGMKWRTLVPRQRVRIWTQDANVMKDWNDPGIFQKGKPFDEQERFFEWIRDNVDFPVRVRRVQ